MTDGCGENLPRLVSVMQRLLGPDGCPWDREQTLESLRPYVIEEAFEVVDAIDSKDPALLREELGDLLLQVVFQAELCRKAGWFGPNEVVDGICDKLERRHPWVFGDQDVDGARGAIEAWEKIKAKERETGTGKKDKKGRLTGVPAAMPALLRAVRIGEKAASVGYDWPDVAGTRAKVDEELRELDDALAADRPDEAEKELGDVLFALASLARKRGMDPEAALRGTLDRFTARFGQAEELAQARGHTLRELAPDQLDDLWNEVKRR